MTQDRPSDALYRAIAPASPPPQPPSYNGQYLERPEPPTLHVVQARQAPTLFCVSRNQAGNRPPLTMDSAPNVA
jgi:hypothetical protein